MTVMEQQDLRGAIAANWAHVRSVIAQAAKRSGRAAESVRVIAVTKTHPVAVVQAALAVGLTEFGENRVQDFMAKRAAVPSVRWHLIGQLQRNKVRQVVDGVTLLHAVDRHVLIDAIQRHAATANVIQPVLIQVNVGGDPAKGGCEIERSSELVAYAQQQANVRVEGLMTVPPLPAAGVDPATAARQHFATLRHVRDELQQLAPNTRELSMGMTADYATAIEEGATMVRIGTALFGHGPTRPHARMEEQR